MAEIRGDASSHRAAFVVHCSFARRQAPPFPSGNMNGWGSVPAFIRSYAAEIWSVRLGQTGAIE
jgi:hypothetical protein